MKKIVSIVLIAVLALALCACGASTPGNSASASNLTSNPTQAAVKIESVDDLANADKIGTQRGTTGYIYCVEDYGEDHVVGYDTYTMAVQALLNGQIDCIVMDDAVARAYVAQNAGLKILETSYADEDYAFGVDKSNEALLAGVNGILNDLISDGTVQKIIDKYISDVDFDYTTAMGEEGDGSVPTINAGKLTISTSPDFPPYEFLDDANKTTGIEPEILAIIAHRLGLELQIDEMDFDSALMAVQTGKSDMVVSGVSVTEERQLVMSFTDSYTNAVQVIVVKE